MGPFQQRYNRRTKSAASDRALGIAWLESIDDRHLVSLRASWSDMGANLNPFAARLVGLNVAPQVSVLLISQEQNVMEILHSPTPLRCCLECEVCSEALDVELRSLSKAVLFRPVTSGPHVGSGQ